MGDEELDNKITTSLESIEFYEEYTEQQNEIASYCYDRFVEEIIPHLPESTHRGMLVLIDNERDRLFGANRVLGGYLPVWLAESLDIDDEETILEASFASFLGRFWFILYDYKLDDRDKLKKLGILEAIEPMEDLTLQYYLQVVPEVHHDYFKDEYARLLQISRDANDLEIKGRGAVRPPFSPSEMKEVGDKIAIVNWTTTALVLAAHKMDELEKYQVMISQLCTAIQFNHDLTDVREDVEDQKNTTLPISIAADLYFPESRTFKDTPTTLIDYVYRQDVTEQVVNIINVFLRNSLEIAKVLNAHPFLIQIEEMIGRNNRLVENLRGVDDIKERKGYVIEIMMKNQGHPELHYIEL